MPQTGDTLNDSDCLIQEPNISCIILDDSHEDIKEDNDQDMEEGELQEDSSSGDNVVCEIKFGTKRKYHNFSEIIKEALKDKLKNVESERTLEVVSTAEDLKLQVKYASIENLDRSATSAGDSVELVQPFDKETSPDLSGISELFTIDTNPTEKLESVNVPSYKRAIKDAMLDEEAAATKRLKQEAKNMKVSKASNCFNCGDAGHSIKECTMPHNIKRIKQAKKAFLKVDRYHVDVEQRFAHLRPGVISDKLRDALGMRKGELPFFFYRMRVLGYPPGWLEDAKVEHSGINLINSDGKKISHSDDNDGDAEPGSSHKYNVSKIIEFPGFNQDPGDGFYDDYKYHNVPPLSKEQSKEEFVKTLGDSVMKGYKRKKLKDFLKNKSDGNASESLHTEVFDMEIEDADLSTSNVEFDRPLPPACKLPETEDEIPPPPPPMTVGSTKEDKAAISDSPQSLTLAELERTKSLLLQELQDDKESSVIVIDDSVIDESQEEHNSTITKQSSNKETISEEVICGDTQGSSDNSKESTKSGENRTGKDVIEKSYMGTPVLKFSPYDALPNGENFKVGVSDVINFENLPDSTGKYENMKELIRKVRNIVHKLHSDE